VALQVRLALPSDLTLRTGGALTIHRSSVSLVTCYVLVIGSVVVSYVLDYLGMAR